jgi:ABC-type phosphate transport system substrate-binding protein
LYGLFHNNFAFSSSTGSTNGVNNLIDGKFAIAFTHAPLSEEQRKKAEAKGPILQIPVLLCGVAPVYNVKELNITHKGQESLKRSTYAPIPSELMARVDQRLSLIKVDH